jgi:hypothetical protein
VLVVDLVAGHGRGELVRVDQQHVQPLELLLPIRRVLAAGEQPEPGKDVLERAVAPVGAVGRGAVVEEDEPGDDGVREPPMQGGRLEQQVAAPASYVDLKKS